MHEKLQSALDAVIQEGTFSLSAIEAVKAMRDENKSLGDMCAGLRTDNKSLAAENDRMKAQISDINVRESAVKAREDAVAKRETTATELDGKAKLSEAVAAAYKDCFGLVFRNQVIHETTAKNVALPGGPNCAGYTTLVTDKKDTTTS